MPIVQLLIVFIVFGVGLWLINTYVPMAAPIKTIMNVVVILILVIWLLSVFGVTNMRVGPIVR
jgi:hypothetical protein